MNNRKLFLAAILIVAAAILTKLFSSVLSLFFVSALLAFLLHPISNFFVRRLRMPKGLAILLVFLFLIFFFYLLFSLFIPPVLRQAKLFIENIPLYGNQLERLYLQAADALSQKDIPKAVLSLLNELTGRVEAFLSSAIVSIVTAVLNQSMRLFDLFVVLVGAIYWMLDARKIFSRCATLFPPEAGTRFLEIVEEIRLLIWKYLKSKTIVAAGVAIATFVLLRFIGIEYALLLAFLTFVLDFIPYFGSIFAGAAATLVALITSGTGDALITGVCFILIQQIESNVIAPKVQGDSVGLHPLVALFAVLACNQILGPFGMFIAVPIATIVKILLREAHRYLTKGMPREDEAALPEGDPAPPDPSPEP